MEKSEYTQLKNSAGCIRISQPAYLRLVGESRIDFIQRQSTNDLKRLRPDQAVTTVLTSATARILDVLTVIEEKNTEAPSLGIICLPGRAEQTARFLQSRIFFMDHVEVENISQDTCQFEIYGPAAEQFLESVGLPVGKSLSTGVIENIQVQILNKDNFPNRAYRLIGPAGSENIIQEFLGKAGIPPVSAEVVDIVRIENGLPAGGSEINEAYTPLEVHLEGFVSDNKGCYTGQEILARQVTYNKITRELAGMRLTSPPSTGDSIIAEGKQAGEITSFTNSPTHGWIALGVLKRPYFEPGTKVIIHTGEKEIIGTMSEIPF